MNSQTRTQYEVEFVIFSKNSIKWNNNTEK